jgi:hypothetical protein
MIDVVVSMASFQFDCLLKFGPFLALLVPVLDPDRQLKLLQINLLDELEPQGPILLNSLGKQLNQKYHPACKINELQTTHDMFI